MNRQDAIRRQKKKILASYGVLAVEILRFSGSFNTFVALAGQGHVERGTEAQERHEAEAVAEAGAVEQPGDHSEDHLDVCCAVRFPHFGVHSL
ncbi:hypothetical protein ACSRUE_15410 [Sorangium sp. KYC3313]|uniref:hypothetical protein n=1 Tax=Sorangium sp. KYC3313 TaxID=3449740 RepID=UPI003F8C197D